MNTVLTIGTSIAILAVFTGAVPPQVCFANFRSEDCGKPPVPVMYYWKSGSRCEVGIWRGCLPNLNMFKNEYECVSTCIFTVRAEPEDYHKLNEIEELRDKYTEVMSDTDSTSTIDNSASYSDNSTDTNPTYATDNGQVATNDGQVATSDGQQTTDSTGDNGNTVTNTGNDDSNNDGSTIAVDKGNSDAGETTKADNENASTVALTNAEDGTTV